MIVTLGIGTFVHGVTLWLGDQETISGISSGLVEAVIVRRLFGVPLSFTEFFVEITFGPPFVNVLVGVGSPPAGGLGPHAVASVSSERAIVRISQTLVCLNIIISSKSKITF